ncbi:SDR family NAD(P)-dependent oxidoreductase [Shouchella clausii]
MSQEEAVRGKTVVVTGASSGFGKGVALKLAAQGANVVLAARRTELLEELVRECGGSAFAVPTDVGKPEEIERLAGEAVARFGRIDVWINNAGVGLIGPFTELPAEDLNRVTQTNLLGTMYGSQIALRHFKQWKAGTLINVGSIAGKVGFPYYTAYSATKFAVTGLTKGLHREMELEGLNDIHVCLVHPWATDTPWFDHTGNYTGRIARMKPMDDPDHVVDAIVDLIANPKEEVEVGAYSKGTTLSSHLFPDMTENINAKLVAKNINDAPSTPVTSGSLHEPMQHGTGVCGGIKERIEREDKIMNRP